MQLLSSISERTGARHLASGWAHQPSDGWALAELLSLVVFQSPMLIGSSERHFHIHFFDQYPPAWLMQGRHFEVVCLPSLQSKIFYLYRYLGFSFSFNHSPFCSRSYPVECLDPEVTNTSHQLGGHFTLFTWRTISTRNYCHIAYESPISLAVKQCGCPNHSVFTKCSTRMVCCAHALGAY